MDTMTTRDLLDSMDTKLVLTSNYVASMADLSDEWTQRLHIIFKNRYQLHIVRGPHSIGGRRGLFEISINNPGANPNVKVISHTNFFKGDLTCKDVNHYISNITHLTE